VTSISADFPSTKNELVIVYDGDCPFCSRYVELVKLRQTVGPVRLVNARADRVEAERLRSAGYDLDEGMIAKYGQRLYRGSDCMNLLALLSTDSGTFNLFNRAVFSSPTAARLLYPVLRLGRNLTLRIMGRAKMASNE
jgi:predicted DCC family thiol-disulfide oxidoreductase YuxK